MFKNSTIYKAYLGTAIQLAKADLLLFICLAYFCPIYDRIVAYAIKGGKQSKVSSKRCDK